MLCFYTKKSEIKLITLDFFVEDKNDGSRIPLEENKKAVYILSENSFIFLLT